ncbi:MAG: hypothetical protein EHM81_00920 [Chloroflexi bacterium]|nr:MAG: hypothetical protein EHM81_00920 [Chloroflexota bacterium]
MPWELPPPWDKVLFAGLLLVFGAAIFWFSFSGYHRRYFFDKALLLALLRTLGGLVLYGGSLALALWLISSLLPFGWLRYLVGGGIWWLLSETVVAGGMKLLDRILEII